MKITGFSITNFMAMKRADVKLGSETVKITGANGQGKTSLVNAIITGILGLKGAVKRPVRDGEKEAVIEIFFDDLKLTKVVRKIKNMAGKASSTLRVENADGAVIQQPQKRLDKLLSLVCLDPLAFCDKSPAEQRKVITELTGKAKELAANEYEAEVAYNKRRDANRDFKSAEVTVESEKKALDEQYESAHLGGKRIADDLKEQNAAEISQTIKEIEQAKSECDSKRDEMTSYTMMNDRLDQEEKQNLAAIEQLKQRNIKIEEERQLNRDSYSRLVKEIDGIVQANLGDKPGTDENWSALIGEHQKTLAMVEVVNKLVYARDNLKKVSKDRDAKKEVYEKFDAEVNRLRDERAKIFASSKLPIPDIELPEEKGAEILYKGIPLSQVSWSEKLVLGCRVAMALRPELRIVRIQNGSELDKNTLAMLERLFHDNDYQLWIELVNEDSGVGIHIEDGEVVSENDDKPLVHQRREV